MKTPGDLAWGSLFLYSSLPPIPIPVFSLPAFFSSLFSLPQSPNYMHAYFYKESRKVQNIIFALMQVDCKLDQ